MEKKYILALDQGTTSSRAILFDRHGLPVGQRSREFRQVYPQPGWVEHDPEEIWRSQRDVAADVLRENAVDLGEVAAAGIANQRETVLLWDKVTGKAVANAIVWQDRRTTGDCDTLRRRGLSEMIRGKTGLVVDPYFSATKLQWLLDHVPGARERAERGELLAGTIDTFLIWRLTGGRSHSTDYANASRTLLFNIHTLTWDDDLLELFAIPRALLPEVCENSGVRGMTSDNLFGQSGSIPIAGVAGDQQAALFGQTCFDRGSAKNTYGTGCFLLCNTGDAPVQSTHGLLTTIGWRIAGKTAYCLEGSVFVAGAVIQYLRDTLGILSDAAESERLAESVPDTGGVFFVPAFVGLGAPHWDAHARGAIVGLTRGSGRAEIARAALEAVAFQNRDLIDAMAADGGASMATLRVDGGMVGNAFLMQFQADVLGRPVERPRVTETTALGAAYLAGLAVGFWESVDALRDYWALDRRFEPRMTAEERDRAYRGWNAALERVKLPDEPPSA